MSYSREHEGTRWRKLKPPHFAAYLAAAVFTPSPIPPIAAADPVTVESLRYYHHCIDGLQDLLNVCRRILLTAHGTRQWVGPTRKQEGQLSTTMHTHLSDFLAGYVVSLGRDATSAPHIAKRLTDMATSMVGWEADALECLYRDIALWFDAGLDEPDVAARLAEFPIPAEPLPRDRRRAVHRLGTLPRTAVR